MKQCTAVGTKFGSWTLISFSHKTRRGAYFKCRCDCGTERVVDGHRLKIGKSKSCGCSVRNTETCKHGHLRSKFSMVRANGRFRCRKCALLKYKKRTTSRKDLALVLEALAHGATIHSITRPARRRSARLPSPVIGKTIVEVHLRNLMRQEPQLAKKLKALSRENVSKNRLTSIDRRRIVAAPALMHNEGLDAYEAVMRATAGIWEGHRDDVQSLMFIAIGEGKLKPSDCTPERAREYLRTHRRRPNVFGSYSLDTPIGEDGNMTWLDTKTDEDRLWA